ncbi:hypothetical protein [Methylocaldum marinum]|nr:hypothetical protein [Methylocaldum marinum]
MAVLVAGRLFIRANDTEESVFATEPIIPPDNESTQFCCFRTMHA